ncbi:MAG: hypothetical protein ABJC63_07040 [Gemmatimonadales bacterium]
MSAAAVGAVIDLEVGKKMPAIVVDSDSSMLRRLTTQEYIDDVGEARILGGVHYRNSVNVGKAMGVSIGKLAVQRFFKPAGNNPTQHHVNGDSRKRVSVFYW